MNGPTFRALLQYRLMIPLFSGVSHCPDCKKAVMDEWGDHALHCVHELGVKFRHNAVKDTISNICYQSGVVVKKQVPLGFLSDEGIALRPADLLFHNWDKGKNVCVDITGCSPFAGNGAHASNPEASVAYVANRKKQKHDKSCLDHGYGFLPFTFSSFGELGVEALELLKRIKQVGAAHFNNPSMASFIYQRVAFSIQNAVGTQLVTRLPTSFM